MRIDGVHHRSIVPVEDGSGVRIIDQTRLPHALAFATLGTLEEAADAIETMRVRGAPLIGATAAYGLWLGLRADPNDAGLSAAYDRLLATRPTAVNLAWALDAVRSKVAPLPPDERAAAAFDAAGLICEQDVALNRAIGVHGLGLLRATWDAVGRTRPLNVLTHCNAGWLATVDYGTALAPIYLAHDEGIPVHVWVDETRPRNQGALTAFELGCHGVPHTVVVDNAGGHLMQRGDVDLCIVGTDRTTAAGDVCNKIGTYLKAVAARDCGVPFYVALPHPTIDWAVSDGLAEIPIEARAGEEVLEVGGAAGPARPYPEGTAVANPAFDVTPARLVTALVTDRGVCPASREGLHSLFPERRESVG